MKKIILSDDLKKDIIKMYDDNNTINNIVLKLNISRRIVERTLIENKRLIKTKSEIIRDNIPELNDKNYLVSLYNEKMLSIDKIAELLKTNSQIIKNAFKRFNIVARNASEAKHTESIKKDKRIDDREWLYNEYINLNKSLNDISDILGIGGSVISRKLDVFKIKKRPSKPQVRLTDKDRLNAKIARNLRVRLYCAIKNDQKKGSAVSDLGCTLDEFKSYIESKFKEGMTWKNWGLWEIDHIIPLSSFDLSNRADFLIANNYSNMQPLWRTENRQKSDKVEKAIINNVMTDIPKVPLYIVTGMCGSGKSWVCNQLTNCSYISYDHTPTESVLHLMLEEAKKNKIIVYDPLRRPISFANRYKNIFDIHIVSIVESVETIKDRLLKRGGKISDKFDKYYDKSIKYAKKSEFYGSSSDVLIYLKEKINGISIEDKPKEITMTNPNEKPTVYLLVGASGSGKSWIANQLKNDFDYISYDNNKKNTHLDLLRAPSNKPKLYDPTFKISTIIRRHSDEFNFIIVAIYETEEVLRERLASRNGTWTDTIMKRNEVCKSRFKKYGNGGMIGTSQEVLEYLKTKIQHIKQND